MKLYGRLLGLGEGSKKVDWILPYVRGLDVLDIGCASMSDLEYQNNNWLHRHIRNTARHCIGIDHNARVIDNLKKLGYDVILGDAQDFSTSQQFDVVVAGDVIEHLENIKGFFTCVRRALKDKGILLLTTPNPWFFIRFIRCLVKGGGGTNPDHVLWLCADTLKQLLERYAFEVHKIEFGSMEPIFYRLPFFPPVLAHTSIFVAAIKKN